MDDDRDALQQWLEGNAEAGRTLVRRHYERILRFFLSKVPADVARDLTQSTFETLCTNRSDFRSESSFLTYLFGIARWKLVHHFRQQQKSRERFDPLEHSVVDPAFEASLTSLFQNRHEEMVVVLALRQLPLDDQIILELRDYEGLTGNELAQLYGVKRTTMVARVAAIRRRLGQLARRLANAPTNIEHTETRLDTCMRRIHDAFLGRQGSGPISAKP